MTCFTYNGVNYTFNEFANLLLSGELEKLALEKKVSTSITNIGKTISEDIKQVNDKFTRKHAIEKSKYIAALNSSDDLIKIKNFYRQDPAKNVKLSDDQVKKQAKLSEGADVVELKKRLASINQAWKQTELLLKQAKDAEITIASQKPLAAKNKFELKSILRNLFNLKKVFKTKDNKTISQDEAAATLMDKVLNTIAQRRSQTEGVPVTAQDIYNNTFYKRSTPEEIKASLNILNQLIGKEGIKNLGIPFNETFLDVAGNQRYELSDFNSKIEFTAQHIQTLINKLKKGIPLKEVFFHETLFRAYPQLMDLKIEMKAFANSRNRGFYRGVESIFDNKKASIVLNERDINGEDIKNLQDTFTTLIHEIQHAIQHIERLDPGTSVDSFIQLIDNDKKATILLIDRLEEAKAKNLTLSSLLSEQDLEVISESLNSIDNINAVPEEDVISYFKEHLRKVKNLTKGDVITMYTNSLGELEANTVEARADFEKELLSVLDFNDMMKTQASMRDTQGLIYKDPMDAFFIVLDQRDAKQSPILFQTIVNNNATPDGVNSIIDASFNKALLTLKVEELANKNKSEVTTLPTLTADEQKLALKIKERVPKVGRKNTPLDPLFKQDWNTGIFSYDEIYLSPFVASDKEDREQIEKFLYNYLIQLNPVLKNIPITLNNKVKFKSPFTKMADIIAGVGSQGLYEDIRFFVEDLNGTLQNKTKKYEKEKSTLEFRLGRDLYYGISPNTISEINKEFNSKGVLFFQAARAAYQSDGSFSIGGGRFDILKEGQDIIHAITDPNVSSPLHEVAHKFEKYLTPEERAIVLSFAETPEWTTATSEKFARGFEKYLAEGKAPTSALQDIFDAFANWLMAIYNGIINSEIDITLNDEMRQIYDAMLGVEKAVLPVVQDVSPITPVETEPIVETIKGENPYATASQIEMSDEVRTQFGDLTPEQLLEQINLGTIEVIKTTDTSNLYILKGEQDPFFSQYGGSLEDATETAVLDKQNQDNTANSLLEQYKNIKQNEATNTENTTTTGQVETTPQIPQTEVVPEVIEPKIADVNFNKTLEDTTPEPTPENLVEAASETAFVQPIVTEEVKEAEIEVITNYNGFNVGDKAVINGKIYKIRSFSKLSGDYVVGASLMQGRFASPTTEMFSADALENIPQEAKAQATRIVHIPVREIPEVGDFVTVEDKTYVVKKVNLETNEAAVVEIVPGLEEADEIIDFIPLPSIQKIVKQVKTTVKVNSEKENKRQKLLTILRYMSDMFNKSIPFEIVDRPGETWAGTFKKGKVYINLSMAETDTPIHEFLHPFVYVISQENPKLYASLLKEMKTKITSKFITKEGDLYFIKNNDSIYGDERGYKTKKEAEEGVKEANSLIYEAYQKHKALIAKEDFYMNTPAAEQEEELLVRVLTERIASVIDDAGFIDRTKADELYKRSSNFMSSFVQMMLMYIDKFMGLVVSAIKGSDRTNLLSKITSTEYNPNTGFFRLYKAGRESKPLTVFIGKNGETLKTGAIKVFLQENFKKETEENINNYVQNIDAELNGIRNENNDVDKALDDRGYYILNLSVNEDIQYIPVTESRKVSDGANSFVDSQFLSSEVLTSGNGSKQVSFVTIPLNTTINNLAAMITNRGLYAIDLSNHKKDFAKLSDRMAIKSPEDLTKFADTFRKKLLTLKNTLETRLKSGDLTEDVRNTVIRNLQQIKPLTDPEFLKNNDFVDIAVGTVKTGFESLMMAEQMMHKIRTKINYGDVNTYVEELEKRLLAAGIEIEYKPNNLFAIRLKKGKVILNKKLLVESGIVPFDIARNAVGDIDGQRNFINEVQQIHTKLIKEMEGTKLTQDEIKQLNWDIATLRNYYATFSGFTRTLLKEYMEHLDYSTEYMEFSNTLLEAGLRMRELEENMRILATDWLFPYFDTLQNNALIQLTPEQRKEKYIDKVKFGKLLRHAEADLSKTGYLFGTIVNTSDPINASVSNIIADIINNNKDILGHLVSQSKFLKDSYFKSKGITTTQQRAQYIKDNFLRKVKVYEIERDEYNNIVLINGEPKKSLVERWAIHTEYKEDEFELAREEYVKTLVKPVPPIERTPDAWAHYLEDRKDYREAIEKWNKDNKEKFRNQEYDKLIKDDEAFKFMVETYEFANDKYGEIKLQYGIIPQAFLENAFLEKKKKQISNIKDFIARFKDKNRPMHEKILGSAKAAANYLVNAQDELSYDRINPDGTEYRSIKTQYLRKLDESELNFDLMDTLVGFSEDSFRYSSLREIQANVENLRLLVNGYYKGSIEPRTVPKLNSNNQLMWDSIIGQTKAKTQIDNRLNKQLNGFIDDIFYGDTNKPARINFYSSAKYKTNLARAKQMIGEGKGKDEIYKETTFYLDKDNQWKSDEYSNVSVSLNKVAQNATFYTSALSLAFNIMSTARNLTIGNFTNFSEAYGGKYYSVPNYFKAQKIYGQAIPDNIKGFVMDEKNKLNQILFNYQAIQGEFRDRYNKLVTDSNIIARLFSKDALFFLQHVAEHQIQGTSTLAFMLSTNVKLKDGTTTNLWDAHILDEHGVVRLREDVEDFDKTRFTRQLHEMNRSNHGNYSNLHKTVIQREWYGSLLMTFRKHMYPTLMARFGKKRMDYSKEAQVEGFHRLFWRKVAEDIMTYGMQIGKYEVFSKGKRGEWAAEEKYGFNRSLMETMFGIIPLMILCLFLAGDDDKQKIPDYQVEHMDSVIKKWIKTLANGLYTDVAVTNPLGLYNPFVNQSEIWQEIKKITTNPVAVQYTYKKVGEFINELTKDVDDEQDRDVAGKFKKIIPIVKHTEFFTNPDEYISGYLKYQSLIGSGIK